MAVKENGSFGSCTELFFFFFLLRRRFLRDCFRSRCFCKVWQVFKGVFEVPVSVWQLRLEIIGRFSRVFS